MVLGTIVGNLRDGYAQLEPGTFLHADQLTAEQVNDTSLRDISFYVADYPQYSIENGAFILWLARHTLAEPNNLVLRHLFDKENSSYDQLMRTGSFRPDIEEARAVMAAKDTLRINLNKIYLQGIENRWNFLDINTTRYEKQLNSEERKLAERFYGSENAFVTAMETLSSKEIDHTRILVLAPRYIVQQGVGKSPIGQVAWRGGFGSGACSYADEYNVNDYLRLRGVRRVVVPVEGASKKEEVSSAPEGVTTLTRDEILIQSFSRMLDYSWKQCFEYLRKKFKP